MRGLLDGSEAISESTLKELKSHWENDVKRLNFAMDKLNREHFHRPIEVSFLILFVMIWFSLSLLFLITIPCPINPSCLTCYQKKKKKKKIVD